MGHRDAGGVNLRGCPQLLLLVLGSTWLFANSFSMSRTDDQSWNDAFPRPELREATPVEAVARLTRARREQRVGLLMEQAREVYQGAVDRHLEGHQLVASCVLFSGGRDSTVLAHLMREQGLVTHAVHANTTIGIEQTREFVRACCQSWDLPLLERRAPVSYRELVLERGFPGPGMHWKMYTRLKERALDAVRSELISNPYRERLVFVAGRRRAESRRRQSVPLDERDGSIIWTSPLALWTSMDLNTYRLMHGDVPINPVSEHLHMSGECLCGAFAKPQELDEIGFWFPEVRAEIEALEREVEAAGHTYPRNRWGHGQGTPSASGGRLCSSCSASGAKDPDNDEKAYR
jgi:3'-phosphoadenosine 5'-phosphosulfate sulfotransferase (PAPS reductase)/FAD synthetase